MNTTMPPRVSTRAVDAEPSYTTEAQPSPVRSHSSRTLDSRFRTAPNPRPGERCHHAS